MRSLLVAMTLLSLMGCGRDVKDGKAAVPFKAESTRGEHFSLLDVLHSGPALVVFLPRDCPANIEVLTYLRLFDKAYKGKLTIIGLYQGDSQAALAWQDSAKAPFPICADWDHLIAEKYGYDRGPVAALISPNTELVAEYRKFSNEEWNAMNQTVAKLSGQPVAKIDLSVAGNTPLAFCEIPIRPAP